eukprot:3493626-Heterocapsa_arctica.AAC.1
MSRTCSTPQRQGSSEMGGESQQEDEESAGVEGGEHPERETGLNLMTEDKGEMCAETKDHGGEAGWVK